MKQHGKRRWVVITVLLCGALALAADEKKKIGLKGNAQAAASSPVQPATIKLNPQHLQMPAGCKAYSPAVYQAWKKLQKNFAALSESFANHEKKYEEACTACSNKTYSQQDMAAAGCLPTDTLAQCNQKLFNHCVNSISMSAGFLLLCGDVMKVSAAAKAMEDKFFNPK